MSMLTVTEAKARLLDLVGAPNGRFNRHFITQKGEPVAVLMSIEDYEGWVETLDILAEKKAMAEIRRAQREIDRGKGVPLDKAFAKGRRRR